MALSGITLLDNLDVKNPDQSIKVRILKTWTQPDKYNPGETLKIEMILMDEQSVMIEAVCNKKYLIKFQKLLKEGDCFIIRKPSLGDNMNPYKILNHPYKVHLNWGSTVVKCMDFRGTQYGFSFSPFEQLIQNSVADNTILDVIGYVYTYFPIQESISTKTGKLCRRIKIHLQDYEGRIIYVTLWDSYADKFSEYMVDKEPGYLVVLIIQFGRFKFFEGRPYVSTTYFATNLFINSDIDDINQFKSKLHCNDQQTTS